MASSTFAVTITLDPRYYTLKTELQLVELKQEIYKKLHKRFNYYIVFELTKTDNVHAHGIVRMKTPNEKEKFTINNAFKYKKNDTPILGFCLVKPFQSLKWIEYIKKDLEQNKQLFKTTPYMSNLDDTEVIQLSLPVVEPVTEEHCLEFKKLIGQLTKKPKVGIIHSYFPEK